MLRAQADRQAQMLRAEGEAQAITTVFGAIHAGQPDQALLAYQYMQMLPTIARGDANKVWIVPSELNKALKGLGSAVGSVTSGIPDHREGRVPGAGEDRRPGRDRPSSTRRTRRSAERTMQEAIEAARRWRRRPASLRLPRQTGGDGRRQRCGGRDRQDQPEGEPEPCGDLAGAAGRGRGRGSRGPDQHRGRGGHPDHLSDPAGARHAAGDGQRVEHASAWLRGRSPERCRCGPSWSASGAGDPARQRVADRRGGRCAAAAGAAVVGLRRHRAGADRDRLPAGHHPAVAVPAARGAAGAARGRAAQGPRSGWLWLGSC